MAVLALGFNGFAKKGRKVRHERVKFAEHLLNPSVPIVPYRLSQYPLFLEMKSKKKYVSTRSIEELNKQYHGKPVLHFLDLEITERCNNACLHCGINKGLHDTNAIDNELKTGDIKKILEEAAELGCVTVRITGGEPLVREDFAQIYLYARNLGLKVLLFTNGTLINQDFADLFRKKPPLEKIEITLYGMHEKSFEAVTGNHGDFQSVFTGIELLKKNNIPFLLKFAVLPQNSRDVDDFKKYYEELGQESPLPSYAMFFTKRVRRDSEKKNQTIEKLRISAQKAEKFFLEHLPGYFEGLPEFLSKTSGPQGKRLFGCGAGQGQGAVDAYGGFSPCLLLKDPQFTYDLKNGSLREALTKFFPARRTVLAEDSLYLERCAKCFLKSLCEQCPAKAWIENGKIDRPAAYYCQASHAQAEYLGLLAHGERAWLVTDWKERVKRLVDKKEQE